MKYYLSPVTSFNFKGDGRIGKTPKDTLDEARKVAIKKIHNYIYESWDYKKSQFRHKNNQPLYAMIHIYNENGSHVGIVVRSYENYSPYTGTHFFWIKGAWRNHAEMWELNKDGTLGHKM